MRFIMLDTETTGLSPANGDRMVEIGAIEVLHREVRRQRVFHHYIHPGREIPEEVVRIHGIDDAKVRDCPRFSEIARDFLEFIEDATLVIHNAPFDLGFLMYELAEADMPAIDHVPVIDTLDMARRRFPHQRNTLDALCDRFGIERGHRALHGALLDAELLAEVYLAMTGGRQFALDAQGESRPASCFARHRTRRVEQGDARSRLRRRAPISVSEEEMAAHRALIERIQQESGGSAIWQSAS